jgi:hypothetical protein
MQIDFVSRALLAMAFLIICPVQTRTCTVAPLARSLIFFIWGALLL